MPAADLLLASQRAATLQGSTRTLNSTAHHKAWQSMYMATYIHPKPHLPRQLIAFAAHVEHLTPCCLELSHE